MGSREVKVSPATSETGIWTRNQGFTLIEVLVVVAIIGLGFLSFTLSVGLVGRDTQLDQEIDRLIALLGLAAEESVLQGREYGLWLDRAAYEFFVFNPDTRTWMHPANDEYFKPRELPENLEFKLWLEARPVVLGKPLNPEDPRPHIMILSSGELTPFELRLERAFSEESYTLRGDADGTTELIDNQADE